MKWISVDERLPDDSGWYLAIRNVGLAWPQWYCGDEDWMNIEGEPIDSITHWMPLPDPPEVSHDS